MNMQDLLSLENLLKLRIEVVPGLTLDIRPNESQKVIVVVKARTDVSV